MYFLLLILLLLPINSFAAEYNSVVSVHENAQSRLELPYAPRYKVPILYKNALKKCEDDLSQKIDVRNSLNYDIEGGIKKKSGICAAINNCRLLIAFTGFSVIAMYGFSLMHQSMHDLHN